MAGSRRPAGGVVAAAACVGLWGLLVDDHFGSLSSAVADRRPRNRGRRGLSGGGLLSRGVTGEVLLFGRTRRGGASARHASHATLFVCLPMPTTT
jgi:hypothetical protein